MNALMFYVLLFMTLIKDRLTNEKMFLHYLLYFFIASDEFILFGNFGFNLPLK